MTHPLTDDIIESELATPAHFTSGSLVGLFTHDDIRNAADWQLEQVVEWLQANLWLHDDETGSIYIKKDFLSDLVINEELIIEDLKKAMRPQEES